MLVCSVKNVRQHRPWKIAPILLTSLKEMISSLKEWTNHMLESVVRAFYSQMFWNIFTWIKSDGNPTCLMMTPTGSKSSSSKPLKLRLITCLSSSKLGRLFFSFAMWTTILRRLGKIRNCQVINYYSKRIDPMKTSHESVPKAQDGISSM